MYTSKILDYKLFNGDIIEIPKINPFIEIVGAVKYLGNILIMIDIQLNNILLMQEELQKEIQKIFT